MRRAAGRRHQLVRRLAAVCAVGAATVGGQAALSATHAGAVTPGPTTVDIDLTPTGATQVNVVNGPTPNTTEVNTGGTGSFQTMEVQASTLHIKGPGTAAAWNINNPNPGISNLNIEAQSGGQTYGVVTTSATTLLVADPGANAPDTFNLATTTSKATVVGTPRNDTFNVTAVSGALDIIGGGGSEAVNFGRQVVPGVKTLADIKGAVLLDEQSFVGAHMNVTLDDTGRNTPGGLAAELATSGDTQYPNVVQLPNRGLIAYGEAVSQLTLNGGDFGNIFVVDATAVPTAINTGAGKDSVIVGATGANGPLAVNGQAGSDSVLVGEGTVNADVANDVLPDKIQGAVTLSNTEEVSVDDSPDSTGRTSALTSSSITGLTTGPLSYGTPFIVKVVGGSGADRFSVTPGRNDFSVDGGDPAPPASPGDTLDVALTDPVVAEGAALSVNGNSNGAWKFSNSGQVGFTHVETLTPAPISVSLSPASISVTAGSIQQLTATGHYANAADADLSSTAAWSRSKPAAASLSPAGLVTALTAGNPNSTANQ